MLDTLRYRGGVGVDGGYPSDWTEILAGIVDRRRVVSPSSTLRHRRVATSSVCCFLLYAISTNPERPSSPDFLFRIRRQSHIYIYISTLCTFA